VIEDTKDPADQTGQIWYFPTWVETVGEVCKWPGRTMGVPGREGWRCGCGR